MRQLDAIQKQKQQQTLSWKERTAPPVSTTPSLLEIQQEQERQLAEEENKQLQHTKAVVPDLPLNMAAVWGGSVPPQRFGGSIWDNVETCKKTKQPAPAVSGALNAQFPALPATAAKKQAAQLKPAKTVAKTQKQEAVVQKLFEATKAKDEFTKWCESVLQGLETSVDIPTLVEFLKDLESPYEVQDYIKSYLGESRQVQVFAQQFLEKRSKMRNASKPKQEDSLWGPAPALNPQLSRQQQSVSSGATTKQQQKGGSEKVREVTMHGSAAPGAGKKKKRMQKVDNSVLGFTVIADPERTNYGDLDKV
jgi:PERQ amino acid-rich with GYF domain-containing protein